MRRSMIFRETADFINKAAAGVGLTKQIDQIGDYLKTSLYYDDMTTLKDATNVEMSREQYKACGGQGFLSAKFSPNEIWSTYTSFSIFCQSQVAYDTRLASDMLQFISKKGFQVSQQMIDNLPDPIKEVAQKVKKHKRRFQKIVVN